MSRGEHPELFAAIGVTYGDGDGSTTFNLPDFRGRFLRGYLGELSGEIGAEQAEGLPDVDLALRMDNPNVRANVKAAPRGCPCRKKSPRRPASPSPSAPPSLSAKSALTCLSPFLSF